MKHPHGPRRCNCLVWAVLRWRRKGGYLAARLSHNSHGKLHLLWSRNTRYWWGYSPVRPRHGIAALLHGPWFRGRVTLE